MINIIENVNSTINDKLILKISKGVLFSIVITLICLFILSVVLTYTNVSEEVIPISIIVISGVSIFIGSILITKKMKKNGIMYGGIIGLIYILILYFISSIISQGFSLNIYSIIMIFFSIMSGMVGGILGINMSHI